ncbi:MAG: hypothetical protein Q7J22_00335, partial [Candidatus Wolfebacteria bacterium]|nr:hypothetical protein [Candidatus Wolfebacteria bacterium]
MLETTETVVELPESVLVEEATERERVEVETNCSSGVEVEIERVVEARVEVDVEREVEVETRDVEGAGDDPPDPPEEPEDGTVGDPPPPEPPEKTVVEDVETATTTVEVAWLSSLTFTSLVAAPSETRAKTEAKARNGGATLLNPRKYALVQESTMPTAFKP